MYKIHVYCNKSCIDNLLDRLLKYKFSRASVPLNLIFYHWIQNTGPLPVSSSWQEMVENALPLAWLDSLYFYTYVNIHWRIIILVTDQIFTSVICYKARNIFVWDDTNQADYRTEMYLMIISLMYYQDYWLIEALTLK